MNFENIVFEQDGAIATVTINRPKALNALNQQTLEELLQCFTAIGKDASIQVVIVTGSGEKAFVAGADISNMQSLDAIAGKKFGRLGHEVMDAIASAVQPVIAAVNGFALGGGCELAIACDMRLASQNAKFGLPEVKLGVIPGFGGTQRLPRLIGKGMANELLFSGNMIDAEEAHRIGLVNRVVPQDELLGACVELAENIAARGPVAVRLCKESVSNGLEMDLKRGCAYERDLFALCFATADQKEGMAAFLEKRDAKFQNK